MSAERPLVLVAEDDAQIRHLIRERLEGGGYVVRAVRTGLDAVAELDSWRFAAVVLDINMPERNGFSVLQWVRHQPRPPPVLMLTARQSSHDVRRAIQLGAKDYLTKPFSEAQLLSRVGRLVRAPAAIASRPPQA